MVRVTPNVSSLGVSGQQAPETQGSPCCGANIIDRQKLFSSRIYRACESCGNEV